jgi:virulence-associated protein VapD
MKILLGSGYKKEEGFVTIDDDPIVNPDYLINLDDVNIKLPFADNSVSEIRAYHILEHIGEGFIPLIQEMYRISEHNAILDIKVPHHNHEVYYGDPTHKRPITVNGMKLFDQDYNREHIAEHNASSGLGIRYKVDFRMLWYNFDYDPFYMDMIKGIEQRQAAGTLSKEEEFAFMRLMREANNVAMNTNIKMLAIKE